MIAPTKAALGRALGRSKAWVAKIAKAEWFPARGPEGWDVAEVVAAAEDNMRLRSPLRQPVASTSSEARPVAEDQGDESTPAARDEPTSYPPELLDELEADEVDPRRAARLAMKMARLDLAAAARRGAVPKARFETLKNALVELRVAEESWRSQARRSGDLIPAERVSEAAVTVGRQFVRALDSVGSLLATQVGIWLEDSEHRGLSPDARRKVIERWYEAKTHEVRRELCEEWTPKR